MSSDFDPQLPSWLNDDENDPSGDKAQPTPDAELPSWLKDMRDLSEESTSETETPPPEEPLPDWVFDAGDFTDLEAETPAEPAAPAGLNSLPTTDEDAPMGDQLPDEFLQPGSFLPPSGDDLTFGDWLAQQTNDEPEHELPDLPGKLDAPLPPGPGTGRLPDWYLGLEALDESAGQPPVTPPPPAPEPEPDDDLSWLNDETLLTGLGETPAAKVEDDFFAALVGETPKASEEDDFFAAQASETPEANAEDDFLVILANKTPKTDAEDDFFATLAGETPETSVEDDNFAALPDAPSTVPEPDDDDMPMLARADLSFLHDEPPATPVPAAPVTPPAAPSPVEPGGPVVQDISWLQDQSGSQELPPTEATWLREAAAELSGDTQPADGGDLFADLDGGEVSAAAGDDADDPFAALWQDKSPEAASPDDDLFAELVQDNAPSGDAPFAALAQEHTTPEDDLFAGLGLDDAPETAASAAEPVPTPDPGDEEIDFSWLEADTPGEAAPAAVDSFPSWMNAPADTMPSNELDWFADDETGLFGPGAARADDSDDDPFANFDCPAAVDESLDWLEAMGGTPGDAPTEQSTPESELDAFFAEVSTSATPDAPEDATPAPMTTPSSGELESFLAGLGGAALPQTDNRLEQPDFDLDDLFSETTFDDIHTQPPAAPVQPNEAISQAQPDFLDDLEANVGGISAGAIVRQQKDRPVSELSERLKLLHERGEELPVKPPASLEGEPEVLEKILPGAASLSPTPAQPGLPGIAQGINVTDAEQSRVEVLRGTLGTVDGEAEVLRDALAKKPARKRRQRSRQLDRILIALVIAGAMAAPFYLPDLRLGDLPAATFDPGSREMAAFNRIEALPEDAIVLVAAEYGPTAAAELDGLTEALLRHLFLVGARPAIVSGNPVGLLHAANIIDSINADLAFRERLERTQPLRANRDYYVVRYLPGGVLGLRDFGANAPTLLLTDIRGQATRLNVNALSDLALFVVVAERAEDVRGYAEQIAPLVASPLLVATGYSAAPLAEPYLSAGIDGLLVGYRDAYTYANMLGIPFVVPPPEVTEAPTIVPELLATEEATAEATATSTPRPTRTISPVAPLVATDTAEPSETAAPTDTDTPAPTETPTSTQTPVPTATNTELPTQTPMPTNTPLPLVTNTPAQSDFEAQPTATPLTLATNTPIASDFETQPTLTNTPRPTATPTATATPTPMPILGRIASTQQVNVRTGPGTAFNIAVIVAPRTEVEVLARNAAETWYQIRIVETGEEGWVSLGLVYIEDEDERERVPVDGSAAKQRPFLRPALQITDEPTAEATIEATPDATDTPVESMTEDGPAATAEAASATPTAFMAQRDERWYAMTLGIIASASIIAIGAAVNVARGLTRRRRE